MRVPEHHHVRILANDAALDGRSRRLDINNMMNDEFASAQFDHFGLPVVQSHIGIAQYCRDRRDIFQLQNQPRQPDVPRVENMIHSLEERRDLRIKVIMRVGNDPDFHPFGGDPFSDLLTTTEKGGAFARSKIAPAFTLRFPPVPIPPALAVLPLPFRASIPLLRLPSSLRRKAR